jgi:hypothetical protein
MYKFKCLDCANEEELDDNCFHPCPICGGKTRLINVEDEENNTKISTNVDNYLIKTMINQITTDGEAKIWQLLNRGKVEDKLDDIALFFEAKSRIVL